MRTKIRTKYICPTCNEIYISDKDLGFEIIEEKCIKCKEN